MFPLVPLIYPMVNTMCLFWIMTTYIGSMQSK